MYYRECDHCGATLDPGEKCDCQDKRKLNMDNLTRFIIPSDDGQFKFDFGGKDGKFEGRMV